MKKLQVKYCAGEKELNDFLMTLNTNNLQGGPVLQSIAYVSEVRGNGTDSDFSVGSNIIAAVQYIINTEE